MRKTLFVASFAVCGITAAMADTTYHDLSTGSLIQDWSNTGLITADDNWSGVPSIVGYRGDNLTALTGVDPTTVLAPEATVDVNANRNDPNLYTTGGLAEFDGIGNPTVALQGSGTADAPYLAIHVNSTGRTNVNLSFTLRDIDGSADNAIQQFAVQYRIGNTGNFSNVPGGYIADATSGPSLATMVTNVSLSMSAWDNVSALEFRVITTNAAGSDEWVGVDDILVSSQPVPEPATLAALAMGVGALLRRRRR